MNALQAIKDRNPEALENAFLSLEEAQAFRAEVLPSQPPDDCRWFWQQIMTEEQLEQLMDSVRSACLFVAKKEKLLFGTHYSLGSVKGLPTLICSTAVAQVFYESLPIDRHSVLRFYLQLV